MALGSLRGEFIGQGTRRLRGEERAPARRRRGLLRVQRHRDRGRGRPGDRRAAADQARDGQRRRHRAQPAAGRLAGRGRGDHGPRPQPDGAAAARRARPDPQPRRARLPDPDVQGRPARAGQRRRREPRRSRPVRLEGHQRGRPAVHRRRPRRRGRGRHRRRHPRPAAHARAGVDGAAETRRDPDRTALRPGEALPTLPAVTKEEPCRASPSSASPAPWTPRGPSTPTSRTPCSPPDVDVLVVDCGVLGEPYFTPDIPSSRGGRPGRASTCRDFAAGVEGGAGGRNVAITKMSEGLRAGRSPSCARPGPDRRGPRASAAPAAPTCSAGRCKNLGDRRAEADRQHDGAPTTPGPTSATRT